MKYFNNDVFVLVLFRKYLYPLQFLNINNDFDIYILDAYKCGNIRTPKTVVLSGELLIFYPTMALLREALSFSCSAMGLLPIIRTFNGGFTSRSVTDIVIFLMRKGNKKVNLDPECCS